MLRIAGVIVAVVGLHHQSAEVRLGNGPPAVAVREDRLREGRAVAHGGTTVMTVAGTGSVVEAELAAGRLSCPGCAGRLAGWGHALSRQVRVPQGWRWVRPRRARCSGCGVTHVLLPVLCLLRRMYSAEIIWSALVAKDGRRGLRGSGGGGSPRAWGSRGRRCAAGCAGSPAGPRRCGCSSPGPGWASGSTYRPWQPTGSSFADAVSALGLLMAAVRQRFTDSWAFGPDGVSPPGWRVAGAASGGTAVVPGLAAHGCGPAGWPPRRRDADEPRHARDGVQHQLPLTPAVAGSRP